MERWCSEVTAKSGEGWQYLKVTQPAFDGFIRTGAILFDDLLKQDKREKTLFADGTE
jgi:hypothetical protein